eukprot:1160487-Pelagomonas_calceolata.AAC.4
MHQGLGNFFVKHIIHAWRSLDNLTPQAAHVSSGIIKTYQTCFGIPLVAVPGWWNERKWTKKPLLPLYLRQMFLIDQYDISQAYAFPVITFEWKPNGVVETMHIQA